MSEWKKVKLGDVLNLRRGYDLPHSEMKEGNIPVAGSNGIIGTHNAATTIEPCITIGRSGSAGSTFIYDRAWAHNTTLYVDDFRGNDPKYLYYLLSSLPLNKMAGGSAVPSLNRNHIHPLNIVFPTSLDTQRRISSILSSLDDKIAVNKKICSNLEAQAQAIFKHWFIDFAPFKDGKFVESELGLIPQGWRVEALGNMPLMVTDYVANGSFASLKENVKLYESENYAYFIRNTDLKSKNYCVFVDEHSYKFLSKSKLEGGEIIISNVGDVGSVHLCPCLDKPMTLGNNIIMIKPFNEYYKYFLYILFRWNYGQQLIQSIKGGSAQPKFNKTDFKSLKIIVPEESVLKSFDEIVSSLFNCINKNDKEIQRLSALRDTLLPKLMSGQIKL